MNKRNIFDYFSHAVNIKNSVIFRFMIYEINKTQRFNNKVKQRQLLSYLWFQKRGVR